METLKLFVGFVLLLLAQSPLVLAIDCEAISQPNQDYCLEILNSGLTDTEKEILISNLDYTSKFFPDHNYILDRNTANLDFTASPKNAQTYDRTFIRNAWVSIFALMPSVFYNSSLYVPENSKLLTGFNYQIQIPSNYYSSGYPKQDSGDCKRIYTLTENSAVNKVFVNNNLQATGQLVNLILDQDSEIKSQYEVNVAVKIAHYKWKRYCVRRVDGRCVRYEYKCEYSNEEIKKDNLVIQDKILVKYYENGLISNITPLDYYNSNAKFKLNFSDSIKVSFEDSSYEFNKHTYKINYTQEPYYILTLIAEDYNQEKVVNLFKQDDNLILKNYNNCKIKSFDFFNTSEKTCNSDILENKFYIKTDKLKYKENETIKINIFPDDIFVKINYGNESQIVKGSTEITAKYPYNKIVAEYGELKSERIIYLGNKSQWILLQNLGLFVTLKFFIYIILKKCFKKIDLIR